MKSERETSRRGMTLWRRLICVVRSDGTDEDTSDGTIEAHTTASKTCTNGISTDNSPTPNGVQSIPFGKAPNERVKKRR